MQSVRGQWALVTGASGGIGRDFAIALAEQGANLVLVARSLAPMQKLADEIRSKHRVTVVVEALDLSAPGAAVQLKLTLDQQDIAVQILINNAGAGIISEFADQSLEQIGSMLRLNIVSLTELTHVFALAMKQRGGGHIMLLASIAAYFPCPMYAAYAATKAYVLSLGEALHTELKAHNVVVTVLSPGVTDTGFFDAAGEQPTAMQKQAMMQPRPVVDIGLAALFRKRSSVVAGRMNRALTLFSRLLSRQLLSRVSYKLMKQ